MATETLQARKLLTIERLARLEDEALFFIIERLLMPEDEAADGPAMTEEAFEKFIADRRRDAADPAERVPGEAVMQKIRARLAGQIA